MFHCCAAQKLHAHRSASFDLWLTWRLSPMSARSQLLLGARNWKASRTAKAGIILLISTPSHCTFYSTMLMISCAKLHECIAGLAHQMGAS